MPPSSLFFSKVGQINDGGGQTRKLSLELIALFKILWGRPFANIINTLIITVDVP